MGERVRAAQAAAAEDKKNQAAFNTPTPLPSFNANMMPQQNQWTYDINGNPVFQVPGFTDTMQAPQAAPQPQTIADYVSKMHGLPKSPAFDALHKDFKHNQNSTLQDLLAMLAPGSGGKPMSPDPSLAMRQGSDSLLARLNAIAPGAYPMGYGSDAVPSGGANANISGFTSHYPNGFPWGKGRMM
jgi:hypothetical protein